MIENESNINYPEFYQEFADAIELDHDTFHHFMMNVDHKFTEKQKKQTIAFFKNRYIDLCKNNGMTNYNIEHLDKIDNSWFKDLKYDYRFVYSRYKKRPIDWLTNNQYQIYIITKDLNRRILELELKVERLEEENKRLKKQLYNETIIL